MKRNNEKYFETSSLNLAAFLFAKDFELLNIERSPGEKRAVFVFNNSPEIQVLAEKFSFATAGASEVNVDARKIFVAIRQIKDRLYNGPY